ncbi:MAG: response regulator [Verrucomicrobiales bacterium]|jgi:CheY-like chemotaxis protein|nr:response regulator [Verrucomicrobiales bacterium]
MTKVLVIVDDVPDILIPLGKLFRARGFEVHVFINPLPALHFIRNNRADVVLSDYRMPQIDGVTFARVLRNIGWGGSLFFMSGYVSELNQHDLQSLGVDGVLEKPFNALDLIEFVVQAIRDDGPLPAPPCRVRSPADSELFSGPSQ